MLVDKINLENGEEVLGVFRRHKFVLILEMAGLFFVALIPAGLYILLASYDSSIIDLVSYTALFIYLYAAWMLFTWIVGFVAWTDYYLDLLAVTNHRLIVTNQKGFFRRSIASFRLERLQEINVEIDGVFATLLDFGTLRAETAGNGEQEFHMDHLPDPRAIKAIIMKAVEPSQYN